MEVEETKATSPTPAYRPQHSPYMLNSHLPDLVNHEKYFRKQDNLVNLNASQEYINNLQTLKEPPQIYNNQGLLIQKKTIPKIDNQIINGHYSKSTHHPIIRREAKHQLPLKNTRQELNMLFKNCSKKPDNYETNTSQAQIQNLNLREFGQFTPERPQQATERSLSLTRVSNMTDKLGVETGERSAENKISK